MITERTSHCSCSLMTDLLHDSSSLLHTAMCACGLAIFASNVYKQGVTSSSRGKGRSAVRDQGSPSDGKQMALQQATNRTKVFRDCKSRPLSHGREHAPLRSRFGIYVVRKLDIFRGFNMGLLWLNSCQCVCVCVFYARGASESSKKRSGVYPFQASIQFRAERILVSELKAKHNCRKFKIVSK